MNVRGAPIWAKGTDDVELVEQVDYVELQKRLFAEANEVELQLGV